MKTNAVPSPETPTNQAQLQRLQFTSPASARTRWVAVPELRFIERPAHTSSGKEEQTRRRRAGQLDYTLCNLPSKTTPIFDFSPRRFPITAMVPKTKCQFRLKIPRCTGRKFPTLEAHEWASLASDGVEPSAVFWRVLGATEPEAKERTAASAPSCPRGGTNPALRRSFNR